MAGKTIVYILGAGASAADGAPLTRRLIANTCLEFWSRINNQATLAQFKPVFQKIDEYYGTNLASGMNKTYGTGILSGGVLTAAHSIDVEDLLTRVSNESTKGDGKSEGIKKQTYYFVFHPLCYETNLIHQSALKHYSAFVENVLKVGVRHCIITFNYDTLLERAMLDPDKYYDNKYKNILFNHNYSNGQRLPWTYTVNFNNVFWTSVPYRVEDESTAEIFLLKLHGSFNWGLCPETDEITMYPAVNDPYQYQRFHNGGEPCHGRQHRQQPLLIPPAREKDLIPALRQVWEKARSFLRQATELHIIGYSAPEADEDAIKLIQKELKPRINELEKIVLANKSANHRIKNLLSIKDCKEYDTFREYLEREFHAELK